MRSSRPRLTPDIRRHSRGLQVWRATPFPVRSFRDLVEHVARLSYLNADSLLFYRGQGQDYQSKSGGSTLYPSIYRGDALPTRELEHRFVVLDGAAAALVERLRRARIQGHRDLRYKRYIQWSILQHYEVADTPLLDLTHSLRVACSFAQRTGAERSCFVYVLGIPYVTNRITVNSEHDLVNVRLLSICPPDALRPHFQEGYLAGTTDVTTRFDRKTDLDFRNRLVAKFAIPRAKSFWGAAFGRIPDSLLFPANDRISSICAELRVDVRTELQPGDIGTFIGEWAILEGYLLRAARRITSHNLSLGAAIHTLASVGAIDESDAGRLQVFRRFRNRVVHRPHEVGVDELRAYLQQVRLTRRHLTRNAEVGHDGKPT